MRVAEVQSLYAYNSWAVTTILDAARHLSVAQFCAPAPVPWGSLRGTLVHALDIEWQGRALVQCAGRAAPLREDDFPDCDILGVRWREEQRAMGAFLAELTDADLAAPLPSCERGALPLWKPLLHLITHGRRHRREAAILLAEADHLPGDLAYRYLAIARDLSPTG